MNALDYCRDGTLLLWHVQCVVSEQDTNTCCLLFLEWCAEQLIMSLPRWESFLPSLFRRLMRSTLKSTFTAYCVLLSLRNQMSARRFHFFLCNFQFLFNCFPRYSRLGQSVWELLKHNFYKPDTFTVTQTLKHRKDFLQLRKLVNYYDVIILLLLLNPWKIPKVCQKLVS